MNEKSEIKITGMHCASCVANIERALKKNKAVKSASVNLVTNKAIVEYDMAKTTIADLEKTIIGEGYGVLKESIPTMVDGNVLLKLKIIGMDNPHCVGIINGALGKLKGIKDKKLNINEKAEITYDPKQVNEKKIFDTISATGYTPLRETGKVDAEKEEREREVRDTKIRFILSAVLSIPLLYFMLAGIIFPELEISEVTMALIQFILVTPIMFAGSHFFVRGFRSVWKAKVANMDTLVALGTGTAYLYSVIITVLLLNGRIDSGEFYYEVAGLLITFILLGRWLEAITKGKTSEAIKKLLNLGAKKAIVIRNGKEVEVLIEEVKVGDVFIVKPGQKVPVDGVVIEGHSSVDESMISGESIPIEKKKGDTVIGATINKAGYLKVKATKVGSDTVLAQIIKLVENAQTSKAPIQKLADKISAVFVPTVGVIALLALVIWMLSGQDLAFSLKIFIAVIIIACPCALGLATPTAVMMGTGLAAEHGIIIKNAEALQKARNLTTMVFDKTGTLTKGKPEVTDVVALNNASQNDVLKYAAIAEKMSEHTLAEAILNYAKKKKIPVPDADKFKAVPGKGIEAKYKGKEILLGNRKLVKISSEFENQMQKLENEGKTAVIIAVDKKPIGIVAIADQLKDTSKAAVDELKKMHKEVIMLTGDNQRTADAIASKLGIKAIAEVLPEGKVEVIKKLKSKGKVVGMVGDGINDAPALAEADMGIAIGAGTDVAIETGEIVLMKNDLRDVVTAIDLSTYSLKKIKQGLFWAFFYNVVGIPVAAGVLYPSTGFLLNPIIAGAAMAFSSVSVVTNALLMKTYRPRLK